MSTTTKNVGRVSIVPKGDWNINNTYIRLDLVTYNGNSYIAKKDVPKNIQLSNNNYWMLMASKGASFAIVKSYASIAAMNADFSNTNVQNGQFVIIDTGNVQDPDNAKLYYKGSNSYVFVTDMSGATGIQGPRGASAYEQAVAGGYTGTETQFNEELASFKELSEQAASSASDAVTAKGAAETAQGKAEDAQEAAEAVLASIPDDYTELSDKVDNLNNTFFAEYGVTTYNEIDTHVKDGNLVVLKQDGLLDGGSYFTVLSGTSFGEVAGFPWNGYIFTKPAVAFGDTVSYAKITCGSDNEWTTENAEVRNINTDIVGTFYYANAYNIGDYVQQNSRIYRFIAPHTAGSYWNTSEVVEVVLTNEIDKISEDVAELRSAIDKNNSVNVLDNVAVSTSTTNGITFSVIDTQTINVAGTSTALANKDIYSSQTMPEWLEKGKQYYLEYLTPSGNVLFRVYIYRNGTLVSTALVEAVSNQVFTIPTDATGIIFRLAVKKNITVNENVTFAVLNAKSNLQLSNNIENLYPVILTTNSADAHNETTNLLNPNTITEGYVLSNNIPVVNSSFYYSDYIEIGMNRFCFSQVGSVSGQVNCYDFNKNYIGTIDYSKNTDHFVEGNEGADTNLRFRTFTPLDGTVYIRVCGGISRPKMVTPFFSPMDYGAKAQNLPYLQTFHKWGLKAAMFGDSIMMGRDGNSSSILERNPVWWVNQLTSLNADNFGVGSMGWVSTRYLSQIAYDKISTTDITGYDLIILCYGVNDTGSTLGSWDSTDETTIMGQVNKCIRYIGSVNPSARIILIAPWNTPGSGTFPDWGYSVQRYGGLTRYDLSNSLKRAAEYYKIGFISQTDSPLNGFGLGTAEGVANGPFAGADGVHPTQEGYTAIGYWLSAKISAIESSIQSKDVDSLKNALNTKAPAIYNTASGAIASFDDGAEDVPLKSLTVNIEPAQSGSGDPLPTNVRPISGWTSATVIRTGKNLLKYPYYYTTVTLNGITYTDNGDGSITLNGTSTANADFYFFYSTAPLPLPNGRYIFSSSYTGQLPDSGIYIHAKANAEDASYHNIGIGAEGSYTISNGVFYSACIRVANGKTINNVRVYPMLRLASETDATFEPYKGNTYNITFPTEAGTVYGGTLDVVNKKLTVDRAAVDMGSLSWEISTSTFQTKKASIGAATGTSMPLICSCYPYNSGDKKIIQTSSNIGVMDSAYSSANDFQTAMVGQTIVFYLATPIVYDLTDIPEIATILGTNNIWADTGDVGVTYSVCLEAIKVYADRVGDSILSAIAPLETSYTASRAYLVGSYLFVGTKFYKVIAAIAEGGTISPSTNVAQTTVGFELRRLS